MVVIRPIEASRSIDIGGVPDTRVDGSIGQGLSQVGGAISNHAEMQNQMALRRQQMEQQADDFATNQAFQRWQDDNALDFAKQQEGIAPSGKGFTDNVSGIYTKRSDEFLRTVPDSLKPKFAELVSTARNQWVDKGAAAEIDQRNNWYRTGITERQQTLQNQVFNDPAMFDAAKEDAYRTIDSSGLSPTEKIALKKKADEMFSLTIGEREVRDAQANPSSVAHSADRLGVPSAAAGQAKRFLLSKTDKDGSHISGMRDEFADKLATMMQAAPPEIQAGLGIYSGARSNERQAQLWQDALVKYGSPEAARKWVAPPGKSNHNHGTAADLSFNGQSLKNAPKEVVAWVHNNANKFGLKFPLANENWHIEDGSTRGGKHAEGETPKANTPTATQQPMDPRFASLSLSQRLSLYDNMSAAAQRGQTAINAQVTAAYESQKGSLQLGIQTGEISSDQQILTSPMKDSDKASLLSALRTRQGDQIITAQALADYQNGVLSVDPYSSDGKKRVDAIGGVINQAVAPESRQVALEGLVMQSGTVPQSTMNQLRAGAESQVPSEVEAALQSASRFSQVNPSALGRRDGGNEVQKKVDDFNYYVNTLNLSAPDAARRIADQNDPTKIRERKTLEPSAKEFRKQIETTDLGSMFDDSWLPFNDPKVGFNEMQAAGIAADYMAIAEEQFYSTGGNTELAKSRATAEMKRLYGTTDITGGKTIMKYPPEKFWPAKPDDSEPYRYVKDQLINDLAANFPDDLLLNPMNNDNGITRTVNGTTFAKTDIVMQKAMEANRRNNIMSRVVLVSTPETGSEIKANQLPGYTVLYKDEQGNLQTLYGKQWRPDLSVVSEAAKRQQDTRLDMAVRNQETGLGVAEYMGGADIPMGASSVWDSPEAQQTSPQPQVPNVPVPNTQVPTVQSGLTQQRGELFQNAKDNGLLNAGGN